MLRCDSRKLASRHEREENIEAHKDLAGLQHELALDRCSYVSLSAGCLSFLRLRSVYPWYLTYRYRLFKQLYKSSLIPIRSYLGFLDCDCDRLVLLTVGVLGSSGANFTRMAAEVFPSVSIQQNCLAWPMMELICLQAIARGSPKGCFVGRRPWLFILRAI